MNPGEDDVEYNVSGLGTKKDKLWKDVEDQVIERLTEEKALDDIWVFRRLYPELDIRLVKTNGVNTVSYTVSFEMKKYMFSFEKRQSIWFLVAFSEVE